LSTDKISNAELIRALYLAFLGREPEASALTYYAKALTEGDLDPRSLVEAFHNCEEYRQRQSSASLWVPAGHYYSPIVDVEALRADAARVFDRSAAPTGVDLNEPGQLSLIPILRSLAQDLPFQETKKDCLLYYFNNPSYGHGDAVVLASMIRHLRPRRILEFGCGFSSCVILDVNRLFFNGEIECTFVDPFPQLLRDLLAGYNSGPAHIVESRAQDIDLDIVRSLQENDILFIDSTHVSKAGSDVNFHFFNSLPALQTGVFIHFHDVFYPFEYPKGWFFNENRSWNELYLLRAFLMYNPYYRIEFFNNFLACMHADLVRTIPWFERNSGGAIWLQKTAHQQIAGSFF
jgi:Methyltransferase domain